MVVNAKRGAHERVRTQVKAKRKKPSDRWLANFLFLILLLILGAVGVILSLCAFVYILFGKLAVAEAMFPYVALSILGAIASGQAVKR